MKLNLKRTIATLAGVAAVATIVPVLAAPAALAAPTNSGTAALSPTSGDSSTAYTVTPPAGAACPGDGSDGWRVTSYVVPIDVDPATLMFNTEGPVPQKYGTPYAEFRMPLLDTFGSAYVVAQPANKDPNAADPNEGKILTPPSFTFAHYGAQGSGSEIPAGAYNIGIACVLASGTSFPIDRFWNNTVTLTASATDTGPVGITWAEGAVVDAVPAAPTLTSVTPGNGTIEAAFTHEPSTPATTGYTVTATPTGGGTPVTATGTASPITVTGLTNNTEYSVTVRATNSEGDSPESNTLTATPADANQQPAVENLTYSDVGAAGSGEILVDWNAPSSGATPTGYEVTLDPAAGTVTVNNADTSAQVTGLTPGSTYEVTVTPLHTAPAYGTAASISATPLASGVTVLEQNVTVIRPAGAVVFTQRCENSETGEPLDGATFGTAPCDIEFGAAERIIPGTGTPYYEATASLNNVQVDANGEDTGWTVTGQMSDFVKTGPGTADSFSGDQLGWDPQTISTTTGLTVLDGGVILPGTVGGLSTAETLASAAGGSSLGIAEIDAALTVQFPINKRVGLYAGTLTMTATPGV